MIKVRILTDKTQHLKGIGKASGKPYDMHLQTAYAFTIDGDGTVSEIPEKFEFVLEQGQLPFPRGDYTVTPDAIFVDRNGRMGINPKLKPVPAKAA
jgi:hypothetical protein